jgi:uncharacterized iron-regulated protein
MAMGRGNRRRWGWLVALGVLTLAPAAWALETGVRVQRGDGTPATLQAVAEATDFADVLYVGEEHGNPSGHHLEAELLALVHRRVKEPAGVPDPRAPFGALRAGTRPVALSLEMFERDVQGVLDEYLADTIREKDLLSDARPWPNYSSDYRPLIEYAKAHGLPVLAANAPKRYVNRVGRLGEAGLSGLSASALGWLAPKPLPSASAAYAAKFEAAMGGMGQHGGPGLLAAQVLRDATMAHAIDTYLGAHPGAIVVQVNGKFHSEGHLGVPEQLRRYRPAVRQVVVTMTARPDAETQGDFVIVTPPMPPKKP